MEKKVIAWFSCGVTSAVACKLAIKKYGKSNVALAYMVIDSAHEDNERFLRESEEWYGMQIERIRSAKYKDQFDVIRKTKYVNGAGGARCTLELKKKVRYEFEKQHPGAIQIFGFEFSKKEINRAIRFSEQYPGANPEYPLIDNKVNKVKCAGLLLRQGIKLPVMYDLGFYNNNCIGCVKGGAGYWNHIRKHFPDIFKKMSKMEREVGRSCMRKKVLDPETGTKKSTHKWLDELTPTEGHDQKPILPDCGTFCEIEFADIMDKRTQQILDGEVSMNQLSLF